FISRYVSFFFVFLPLLLSFLFFFFFNATSTTEIYTLSLHDALPIYLSGRGRFRPDKSGHYKRSYAGSRLTSRLAQDDGHRAGQPDRKSTRLNSSHVAISYAVFCLKKKNKNKKNLTSLNT